MPPCWAGFLRLPEHEPQARDKRATIEYQGANDNASGSTEMRTLIVIFSATALLAAGSLWSQETDPARQIAEAWQAEQAQRAEREQRLNELMTVMSQEMEALRETGDREKHRQLMATHRNHMFEAMDLMRDLGGAHMREVMNVHLAPHRGMHDAAGMEGMGGSGHMMMSQPRAHMSDAARLSDLETRVDMMQIMLESMLLEDAGS